MDNSETNSLPALDLLLQARMLLEIILHPASRVTVLQNWRAFYMTKLPKKLMYFTSTTGWVDIPFEAAETIKRCFERRGMVTRIYIRGAPILVNLLGMVFINSSGRMRSIAWVDTDGKSYFPKDIADGGRSRAAQGPAQARPFLDSSPDLIRLEQTSVTFRNVRNILMFKPLKGIDQGVKISAMYYCIYDTDIGKSRLRTFIRMVQLTKMARTEENSRYGWYGADPGRVEAILSKGFTLEDAIFGTYGAGIYLSSRDYPHFSTRFINPDANGEYYLFLCQIILGTPEKLTQGARQYAPSTEDFDNGIDDYENPKSFIIWTTNMSTHILPRCLVTFKVSQPTEVEHHRRLQPEQSPCVQSLAAPIPLRSETSLPRHPRYLERYRRNKANPRDKS